jgi:hypothetical protein
VFALLVVLVAGTFGVTSIGAGAPDTTIYFPTIQASHPPLWPRFNVDQGRSGVNSSETKVGASNVSKLVFLWQQTLPSIADSAPAYDGTQLYLTTKSGTTLALDPSSGDLLWSSATRGPEFTTSSPVLDPSDQWVYGYGLDGAVHKYAAATGAESVGAGWPAVVTLLTSVEKESSALNLANNNLYVTTSGYPGDFGHYDGHLVVVNLGSGAPVVFNTLCSNIRALLTDQAGQANYCPNVQSGVWARSGAVVDPTTGNVFIATGNGPWDGANNWGDSVLELTSNGNTLLDSYTPTNQQSLNNGDVDLGSSAPALLPQQSASSAPFLAVEVGKDGLLRLLNRQNLSGAGGPGHLGGELQTIAAPGTCEVLTALAVWTDSSGTPWLFVANDCGLGGYKLTTTGGTSRLASAWQLPNGGSSPIVANGVLYVAHSGAVDARDPLTGNLLWSSAQTSTTIGGIHWESPILVDGKLYVADENAHITAYGLPGS